MVRLLVDGVGVGVAGVGGCGNAWQVGTFPITGYSSAAPCAAARSLQERLSHAKGPCPLAWMQQQVLLRGPRVTFGACEPVLLVGV